MRNDARREREKERERERERENLRSQKRRQGRRGLEDKEGGWRLNDENQRKIRERANEKVNFGKNVFD